MTKKQVLIGDRKYNKYKKERLICATDRKGRLVWINELQRQTF